ncbi:thiazole biosynthesis adenylyltransferase ThiF [Paenibacillus sediminis]|uniref:Molybdopterin/thiamine biosynthesis adenylyltransferase n=1 Tax=Paenibacillus sediminis TaxID=664909 RepID=A0ABS4H063_9BACL|nr:thiazole biosynthesis adenylyltransferase ThiF [Paenibacillus sediminis]MBP1935918.1 molybdopterin/thiamine biosynthesis adenylyltransferase [Paenibacillus sediminis]
MGNSDEKSIAPSTKPSAGEVHQKDRYSRQERFTPIGKEGQRNIGKSHVLVIGAGALGTNIAETLVRAGVGHITIADRDYVEWSNLQRQQLFSERDAEARIPKAIAAKERLTAVNSLVTIDTYVMDVTRNEIEDLINGVDLIMDATDNFDIRLLINDISQKHSIPWIYGGCVGSYGITYTIIPGHTPCLNCLLETAPLGGDTCDTAGIIPPAVQMVAAHQTTEALKLLTGHVEALRTTLLSFDLWRNEQFAIHVAHAKNEQCLSCGSHATYPYLSASNLQKSEVLCGRDTVQIRPAIQRQINLQAVAERLSDLEEGTVERNPFLVSFTVGEHRIVIFQDGRALIHGTKNIAEAKTLYHKYFG